MGSMISKRGGNWRRCRQCKTKNVRLFERVCHFCETGKRLEPTAKLGERAMFGEYLCTACDLGWSSRMCWPSHYRTCKRCKHLVYPHHWRDLTVSDLKQMTKDHQREECQKCLSVGYYCGDYAKQCGKL